MFHLILYEPEIPPNTGNIIRLCANTGVMLHLIKPLGFKLEDRQLKRAGLDYHEFAALEVHDDWSSCVTMLDGCRLFAASTKGGIRYDSIRYQPEDAFVMGPETRGLPLELLNLFAPEHRIRLPMLPSSRSLNLSNAAAVIVFEAWRQNGFRGGS